MPVPINNSRPSLPYQPTQSLPNNARFDILTTSQRPPTAEMLDAEFNALTDDVNMLAVAINDVQAGSIPGFDNPVNANKLVKTDGAGNLSWTLITNTEMAPGAVVEQGLGLQSVTTPKIGDAAVTNAKISLGAVTTDKIDTNAVTSEELATGAVITAKLSDNAVTTPKLADLVITQGKLANSSVGTAQLIDANVTTTKIANNAVTAAKLSSSGAAVGTVATSGVGSSVSWSAIPTTGKILQIASYVTSDRATSSGPEKVCVFNPHFVLTLTPKSSTSFIGLLITMQAAPLTVPGYVSARLYRNQITYIPLDFNSRGAMFSKYITATDPNKIGPTCFSGFFQDTIAREDLSPIVYEIVTLENVILNGDQNEIGSLSFTTVSSIYAIEIQL